MLKFYVKVFDVMGKGLSGELSCPCDRSCFFVFFHGNRFKKKITLNVMQKKTKFFCE